MKFLFTAILIISAIFLAISPVRRADAWDGLIEPYCHGKGINQKGELVEDGSCTLCDGIRMFKGFLDFLTFDIALPLAMLAVLIAGVEYVFAGANPSLTGKARKLLTNTVIGLAYMFGAWLIINTMLAAFGATAIQGAWDPAKWFIIKCV